MPQYSQLCEVERYPCEMVICREVVLDKRRQNFVAKILKPGAFNDPENKNNAVGSNLEIAPMK